LASSSTVVIFKSLWSVRLETIKRRWGHCLFFLEKYFVKFELFFVVVFCTTPELKPLGPDEFLKGFVYWQFYFKVFVKQCEQHAKVET